MLEAPTGTEARRRTHEFVIALLCLFTGCARSSPDALYDRARSLLDHGNLTEALSAADAGYRAEPSWRFRLLRAEVLIPIDPRKALEALQDADPPPAGEVQAEREKLRGWASYLLSDYSSAESSLNRAYNLASALTLPSNSGLIIDIDIDRGIVEAQLGNYTDSEDRFRGALTDAARMGDRTLQARAMGSLGWLFLMSHRPEEATFWLEKELAVEKSLGRTRAIANALGNLGSCYHRLGDYDTALEYFRQVEQTFREIGDRHSQQIWLGNIGNVFLDRGDSADAVEPYQRALAIARAIGDQSWVATWLNNLALVSINTGDYDAAERYNREALALKANLHQTTVTYPRVNEAHIAAGRKNFALAEKLYSALLAEPSGDPALTLEAHRGLAELLVQTQQFDRAGAQFRSAITSTDRRRAGLNRDEYKLSYFSSLTEFYQLYVDFLVSRGETERALEVAESSHARLLDEKLRGVEVRRRPITAAALRQLARASNSALLSYWLAPQRSFLWVITPGGIKLHILPPEKQIAALIEEYRALVENLGDPLASELGAARKLAAILLGPVGIADGRLIAVPDRALHSLNLETLPDPENPSQYAIARWTFSVAPSLGVLLEPRGKVNASRSVLLIGDPEPAAEEFPKLAYAGREMEMIGRNFPPQQRVMESGAAAFPAAYRAADPSRFTWIHFAAHAEANRESPLDSALILSRHGGAYTLAAREVMRIPLNADLVTLSACRSAGAKTYSGEGLVGLTWAFLRAGARSVVAGLWDVTDMSTANLMADFYAELGKGASLDSALRDAKLRLIGSRGAYRKPFYWGPFQLYLGAIEPRPVNQGVPRSR